MYKIRVDKATVQNHLHYDWWKYLIGIAATIFIWTGEPRIYGLPLKDTAIFEDSFFDVGNKVIVVMVYSRNMDKAIEVLRWIFERE